MLLSGFDVLVNSNGHWFLLLCFSVRSEGSWSRSAQWVLTGEVVALQQGRCDCGAKHSVHESLGG
jgi:hypothetical protein